MTEQLLQVEALEAGYGDVQVLWGLSVAAAPGVVTTLVGANKPGAGEPDAAGEAGEAGEAAAGN